MNEIPIYMIVHVDYSNWIWNNNWGWMVVEEGGEEEISMFTEEEKNKFNLPIDGKWKLM